MAEPCFAWTAQPSVVHIAAYSPEARGRSERMFGTLQDRLIKELRLAGIRDVATANAWIRTSYLPGHNQRFMVEAALPDRAFVTVEANRLAEALCIVEERTVQCDNAIAWNPLRLQIPESPLLRHYVRALVKVHAYPDGTLAVLHGPRVIGRCSGRGELLEEAAPAHAAGKKQSDPAVLRVPDSFIVHVIIVRVGAHADVAMPGKTPSARTLRRSASLAALRCGKEVSILPAPERKSCPPFLHRENQLFPVAAYPPRVRSCKCPACEGRARLGSCGVVERDGRKARTDTQSRLSH